MSTGFLLDNETLSTYTDFVSEPGEIHGPFFLCPSCDRVVLTNDPVGRQGYCKKCKKLVILDACKPVVDSPSILDRIRSRIPIRLGQPKD
jgi:hypothetical protein